MSLNKVFEPFIKETPICVMARATLQRLLDPQRIDELFARTAQRVNEGIGYLSGAAAYVWGAILTLARFDPFDLTLTTADGATRRAKSMFVSFANTPTPSWPY